jgi:membrane fusion protein (multidrug efflux system)
MSRLGVLWPLTGLLLLALGAGCQGGQGASAGGESAAGKGGPAGKGGRGDKRAGAEAEGTAAPVEVVALLTGPISDGIESTATVEASLAVSVRAGTGGTLGLFTADEGSAVSAGEVLLRIDRPGTAGALAKARAQVGKARADARALKKLSAEGLVPGQQQEDADFALRQAELDVEQLSQERALEKVTSPIDGVITARFAQPGEEIAGGEPLFEVADLSALEAQFRVPERHIARLRPGLPVEVTAEGVGSHRLMATVERIAPVVDPASGTIKVTVALGDGAIEGGPRLRPGMYIRARLVIDSRENAVRVPKRALVREDDRVFVFRVTGEGDAAKAEKVPVVVGYADRDVVEAREGLAGGDAVVVFGQRGLADGAKVRVVQAPAAAPADAGAEADPGKVPDPATPATPASEAGQVEVAPVSTSASKPDAMPASSSGRRRRGAP